MWHHKADTHSTFWKPSTCLRRITEMGNPISADSNTTTKFMKIFVREYRVIIIELEAFEISRNQTIMKIFKKFNIYAIQNQ